VRTRQVVACRIIILHYYVQDDYYSQNQDKVYQCLGCKVGRDRVSEPLYAKVGPSLIFVGITWD
jgi:nitrate reductase cytochrome c-type subunit